MLFGTPSVTVISKNFEREVDITFAWDFECWAENGGLFSSGVSVMMAPSSLFAFCTVNGHSSDFGGGVWGDQNSRLTRQEAYNRGLLIPNTNDTLAMI
jgi:hypothetical protein